MLRTVDAKTISIPFGFRRQALPPRWKRHHTIKTNHWLRYEGKTTGESDLVIFKDIPINNLIIEHVSLITLFI